MSKLLQMSLLTGPAVVGAALGIAGAVFAAELPGIVEISAESIDLADLLHLADITVFDAVISDLSVASAALVLTPK